MRSAFALAVLLLVPLGAGCLEGAGVSVAPAGERLTRPATDEPGWPALEDATIRPGVIVRAALRDCFSNFVFTRPDNTSTFLGVTAHCVEGMAVGEWVVVDPGRTDAPAMIVYSSWATMQERGEKDANLLEYNDFAVLRIKEGFRHLVHPAVLGLGGPTGLADGASAKAGDVVISYGPALDGVSGFETRRALVRGHAGEWAVMTYGAPPGLPGRLGNAALTPDGLALGIVVTLGVFPDPGANAVARLDAVMAYAREHANLEMWLATWETLEGDPVRQLEPVPPRFHALTT